MKKRIHLRGTFTRSETAEPFFSERAVSYTDADENLVRYENDGVSVLRVRAGDPERWFPNWRVIEVSDVPESERDLVAESLAKFEPVTPEDLGYAQGEYVSEYDIEQDRRASIAG